MGTMIHPTKHALERFGQRIMPLFDEDTRNTYKGFRNFRKLISQITLFAEDIYKRGSDIIKADVFLTVDENPPIPITLIIHTKEKKILTLYTRSGWELISGKNGITWRWFS